MSIKVVKVVMVRYFIRTAFQYRRIFSKRSWREKNITFNNFENARDKYEKEENMSIFIRIFQ